MLQKVRKQGIRFSYQRTLKTLGKSIKVLIPTFDNPTVMNHTQKHHVGTVTNCMCDVVSRSRNSLLIPSFESFLHCLKESRKTMKAMIDKRNHHVQ